MNPVHEKQKATEWARQVLASKALIIDFETTGIKNAEIVQIGVVDTAGNVLMDSLVKPMERIPAEVTRVHGITNAMVQDAPTFNEIYIKFSILLAGKQAVAYNADFEEMVLNDVCKRHSLPLPRPAAWSCAMRNYATFWGKVHPRGGFAWQKLSVACTQQNVMVENAHNAVGDCLMTLGLIQSMAR